MKLKKYTELILILALSSALTLVLLLFLRSLDKDLSQKSSLQKITENASHRWNDFFYRSIPESQSKPDSSVIILAIDEPSIIEIGRWPWSRTVMGKITEQLMKFGAKTVSYDIIFSEKENAASDSDIVRAITNHSDHLILGTFSDSFSFVAPYQDYCITQAFLATGGASLAKINPFFSVDDETNIYEELEFNQLFSPIFQVIEHQAESDYLQNYDVQSVHDLTQYQLNTLSYYKTQRIYDYCGTWLTSSDPFDYKNITEIRKTYLQVFKANDFDELQKKISFFKKNSHSNPIPQYSMWRQNIADIQNVAQYTASFLLPPDADGIVRNYPLVFRTGNQLGTSYIPSLALQAYLASTGYQALFKLGKTSNSGTGESQVDRVEIKDVSGDTEKIITDIPVDRKGRLLINYYGKQNSIIYVSAKEILNSSPKINYLVRTTAGDSHYIVNKLSANKADFLKNKNIIFGATAVGIYDIRTVPNDINYPGPEIHATVLSNLFQNSFMSYERKESQQVPIFFFIFIFISLGGYIKTGIRFGSALFALQTGALMYFEKLMYERGYLFQSSFLFIVLLFGGYFISLIYKYFFQSKKSKEMKMAFSKYVSKDVVEEILRNENAIELRGQKLFMSVYFSDIRGFTEFSEKMDPLELSELLNKYFTPMSAIITKHQGTIDKYIGDAVMAMFGAPINYPDHATQACRAALQCVAALENLNIDFKSRGWPRIDIGIGINSGFMNAGNIGSETIQNYTVIGDSVNLASRLESLNKEYKTHIIISEYTYEIIKNSFECRELGTVNVKGKKEPVRIYELLSVKSNPASTPTKEIQ